ncbi:unnamed protein product [Polarella glacialis]|uniref:Uncharacterized protein n=1 Tax=Polarella glacialis TaxID=89957 RepID=A0A813HEX6_POLGL|nr:unnamed protein product [Polarella glacialis]
MSVILASICLAMAGMMGMVAAAVLAYVLWNVALWWLENRGPNSSGHAANGSAWPGCGHLPGEAAFSSNRNWPPSAHGMGGISSREAASNRMSFQQPGLSMEFFGPGQQASRPGIRPACVEEIDSPSPRRKRHEEEESEYSCDSPAVNVRQRSAPSPARARAEVAAPPAGPEELLRGYAAQLALKFAGDLNFHMANVSAVRESYDLKPVDICYCFLCLEAAASGADGSGLALKKWGTGQYGGRIWVVALARFVRMTQRHSGAQDESRVQPLCQEWGYQQEHFIRELHACETPFRRHHGQALITAFQQNDVRQEEVFRARSVLAEHGAAAAPKGHRAAASKEQGLWARQQQALPAPGDLPELGGSSGFDYSPQLSAPPQKPALTDANAFQSSALVSRTSSSSVTGANNAVRKRSRKSDAIVPAAAVAVPRKRGRHGA